jgi:hypothetical protein
MCLHRHEHACITNTSRHGTSRHAASCWPRCKSWHLHKHARRTDTGTHATETPVLGGFLEGLGCCRRRALEVASFVPAGTCPEQGSHTEVLDGSLFEKEQGGHTFALEPNGLATACCASPGIPLGLPCVRFQHFAASATQEPPPILDTSKGYSYGNMFCAMAFTTRPLAWKFLGSRLEFQAFFCEIDWVFRVWSMGSGGGGEGSRAGPSIGDPGEVRRSSW